MSGMQKNMFRSDSVLLIKAQKAARKNKRIKFMHRLGNHQQIEQ